MHFFKYIHRTSLAKQFLVLYLVTVIVCMVIFIGTAYFNSRRTMVNIGSQNAQSITAAAATQVSSVIDDIQYQFLLIQNNEQLEDLLLPDCPLMTETQVEQITNILNSYDAFQRKIEKIQLFSLQKSDYPSISDTDKNVFRSTELLNDVWFKTTLKTKNEQCIFIEENADNTYITISKLIVNTVTKEPSAIVKAYVNVNTFYSTLKNINLFQSGRIFITTSSHIINPNNDKFIDMFVNNTDIFNNIIVNKVQSSFIWSNGERYSVFCYPIQNTGLYLIGAVNTNDFNILGHSMIISVATTSFLLALFVFIVLYFISYSFIKPIKSLSITMQNFQNEDSEVYLAENDSSAEINLLYRSFNKMSNAIKQLLTDRKRQAKIQRETELHALQAQIKPHFLYNVLNSIAALAEEINAVKINHLAVSLAAFYRSSLSKGCEFITVREELEQISNYAEIQKIRFGNKFELNINVDDNILDCSICKLLLQPLIENCIDHGFEEIEHGGLIEIDGRSEGDNVFIDINDNGYGCNYISIEELNEMTHTKIKGSSQHYGIYNTAQRIHLYYGEECGLTYSESKLGGICASITLSKNHINIYE